MKLQFEQIKKESPKIGDIVLLNNGSVFLLCSDYCGSDCRGVDLINNSTTDYFVSIADLLDEIINKNNSGIARVIKADKIELKEIK